MNGRLEKERVHICFCKEGKVPIVMVSIKLFLELVTDVKLRVGTSIKDRRT